MKAKTLIELLSLGTNLYIISKDEKLKENIVEFAEKGKQKVSDVIDSFSEEGEQGELMQKFMHKAKEAKEEIEKKMIEVAEKVYTKMHIAHTGEVKKLEEEIITLKKEVALAEARILQLENIKR